jgi:phosphopantetheine adenylyltransferase
MPPLPSKDTSLLLLPALSLSSPPSSLRSAYKTTLDALLPTLVTKGNPEDDAPARLDIAVVLSESYPLAPNSPRSSIFVPIQSLFSSIYSLVVSSAAKSNIDLDFPGGLDVRVFVLEPRILPLPAAVAGKQSLSGPIIDITTFVKSSRHYATLYTVDGEAGEQSLKQLITAYNSINVSPPSTKRLPSGPAISPSSAADPSEALVDDRPLQTHTSVAVGGTFDHIHIGHKLLLTGTILAAEPGSHSPRLITVGITGDELLVNKKYGNVVESWDTRQQRTAEFVESILTFHPNVPSIRKVQQIDEPGPNGRVVRITYSTAATPTDEITINYTKISDPYGPTIADENISALVISAETRAGGAAVNEKRGGKGWKALEVFEVDVLDAGVADEDDTDREAAGKEEKKGFDSKISSTEIRRRVAERLRQQSQ